MGNDELSFVQELVSDTYTFVEQSAGVLPKIENQAFQIALLGKGIEGVLNFVFGGFVETGNVHVADARSKQEVQIHAVAWNLITHNCEFERFVVAFPENRNVNSGALGAFQQIGDIAGVQIVSWLTIDRNDDVSRMNAGAVCRGSDKRCNNDDLIIARPNRHSHPVVFAALVFPKERI